MAATSIQKHPAHLGLGSTISIEPEFTGAMEWYEDYIKRNESDGNEGWLVTSHTFTESWGVWEMHPAGHELVLCLAGSLTLHQENPDGEACAITLTAGEYALNAPGVWHTADVDGEATALFITAGLGTQHRPRN